MKGYRGPRGTIRPPKLDLVAWAHLKQDGHLLKIHNSEGIARVFSSDAASTEILLNHEFVEQVDDLQFMCSVEGLSPAQLVQAAPEGNWLKAKINYQDLPVSLWVHVYRPAQ